MSLGEFHSAVPSATQAETTTAAPTQATPQLVRINWADEMEKLDDTNLAPPADFVFDRSKLPSAPKAVLAPEFDLESVPKKPPFTAHLSNVSFEADEAKIRGFFRDSKVLNVRLPLDERGRFKGHGFVDFEDRESLIAALQKNETSFFNRQIRVALESAQKKQYHHQNQQQTENKSDEADWRRPPPAQEEVQQSQPSRQFGGYQQSNEQRGNRYQQRRSGGQNQWQQVGGGQQYRQHHQQDQQQQRRQYSGYQQRQQKEHGYSSGEHSAEQLSSSATTTPTTSMTEVKERPKLNLAPRTIPVVDATSSSATEKSASIFGSAKPVNTAAREREIEEKIKKEREEVERIEKERKQKEEEEKEKGGEQAEAENTEETKETMKRTHKTSYSSDHHKSQDNEFQVVGGSGKPRYNNKNDNNNNNTIRNQNRLMQSGSFTSPPGSHQQRRDHPQQYHKKQEGQQHERYNKESAESSKPAENVWQSRNAATDLFNKERPTHSETGSSEINHRAGGNRQPHQNEERRSHPHPNRRPDHQNRPQSNRDNKDRRQFDRNKQMNKNPRGERPQTNDRPVRNPRQDNTGFGAAEQSNKNDLGFVNKFSNLAVDVEDADEIYDDNDEVEQEA